MLDDFVWQVLSVVLDGLVIESSSDQSLGGEDGVFGVSDGLSLGGGSDKSLTFFGEGDD